MKKLFSRLDWPMSIKTGLAAALSIFACITYHNALHLPLGLLGGLWSAISSIVIIQDNLGRTYKAAFERFLGTLVGAILGGFFTSYFEWSIPLICVAVAITILVCSLFALKESFRLAALTVALIMVLYHLDPTNNPWSFSLFRFFDSLIGIIIGIVISSLLWPQKAVKTMQKQSAALFLQLCNPKPVLIKTQWQKSQELLKESEMAFVKSEPVNWEKWSSFFKLQEQLCENLFAMAYSNTQPLEASYTPELKEKLALMMEHQRVVLQKLADFLSKTEDSLSVLPDLDKDTKALNEALIAFRNTRKTFEYSFEEAETFFTFFHYLKQVNVTMSKLVSLFKQQKRG